VAYDIGSVRSLAEIQRVLDITSVDTLSLENTPARGRLLNTLALTAIKLCEVSRFDD
jgi:hypothetical protein